MQFLPTIVDAQAIRSVHDPDERVRLLEVIAPIRPERLLTADVPYPMPSHPISLT